MTDFEKMLQGVIPAEIRKEYVCVSEWEPPKDFTKLTKRERRNKYYDQVKRLEVPPTETNYWIWFGAYSITGKPRFNDESTIRILYNYITNGWDTTRRIVNYLSDNPADVNPYKAALGRGPLTRYANLIKPPKAKKLKGTEEELVTNCMAQISNDGYLEFEDDDIRKYMAHAGYPIPVIEIAIKNLRDRENA